MMNEQFSEKRYGNDDHSRFASPDYLDRISLSHSDREKNSNWPLGYRRADSLIYEDACEALLNDPYVDASNIIVEVSEGVVSLIGHIESRAMKKNSEVCIEHIRGIVDVFNMLKIYQFKEAGPQGIVKYQSCI